MKILHIFQPVDGGVPRFLELLLPLIHDKEIVQSVICSNGYSTEKIKGAVENIYPITIDQTFNPTKVLKTIKTIRNIIKQDGPDIVYCHSTFAGVYGRLACVGLKCKVIYNPHGWAFSMKGNWIKKKIFILVEKILAIYTNRIICISKYEEITAISNHISRPKKFIVINNGIDFKRVDKQIANSKLSKKKLGIPANSLLIGSACRISKQKAPDTFIKMAKLIATSLPNAYFMIIGDGDERVAIETMAKELGISSRVIITGWTDTPAAYENLLDIAVLLSRWEGFGLVLAEYMYLKKPIVATNVGAIPNLVENKVNGIIVNPDSPKEAADAIVYLDSHKNEAKQFVESGYRKTKSLYDINRNAQEHINLFDDLIHRGGNIILSSSSALFYKERRAA